MSRKIGFDMMIITIIMEIVRISDSSIKIKSKNATIVVDPTAKTEGDVVIMLDPVQSDASLVEGTKVIIQGPGEYEIAGVSISGEKIGSDIMYRLDDEVCRVILASSKIVATAKEEEGDHALLLKAVEPVASDGLSSFVQDVCVVFGVTENLPQESDTVKKLPKINLRKLEGLKGSVIILSKD